jgi:hypothetical protein
MKYICLNCNHEFDTPSKTYTPEDMWCTKPIPACPECLSSDYTLIDELEFKIPPKLTVKPVSTAALEAQARKMLALMGDDTQ